MNLARRILRAIRRHLGVAALLLAAGIWTGCKASDPSATAAQSPDKAAGGRKVAVIINGEAVYEDDLAGGLPADAFQETLDEARMTRLDRLYRTIPLEQFLKAQKIEVTQKEIDDDIADLRKNPPAAGCMCCRYESVEQYMKLNYITPAELERMSRTQLGIRKYLEAEWQKAYHIFFNAFQDPEFKKDAEAVTKKKQKLAEEAWNRLQKGEAFDAVAKAMSEDRVSSAQGGFLGYIPKDVFGKEFAAALVSLTPGTYSKPVQSTWGWHIIRRETMTDDDLLSILKDDFMGRKAADLFDKLDNERKVEQPGKAPAKTVS